MKRYQLILLVLLVATGLVCSGCEHHAHPVTLQQLALSTNGPKVIAAYQPWFGDSDHIRVGYDSNDPAALRKQIGEAKNLGIYAFAVDWYGTRHPFLDRSYALLQKIAATEHFHVALMYDETEENTGYATDEALEALALAYRRYLGPDASGRDAYLQYQGRPVIFIFPKRGHTDWTRVRQMVNQWPSPPVLIYKDDPPPEFATAFDGEYAWVHPGSKGWSTDGRNWGEEYLQTFYKKMHDRRDQIVVGTIWPGFDDSRASWSLNRRIDPRCGQTLRDTLQVFADNNEPDHPIPFLMIATWNDYEEGTAIENGLARCENKSAPHS